MTAGYLCLVRADIKVITGNVLHDVISTFVIVLITGKNLYTNEHVAVKLVRIFAVFIFLRLTKSISEWNILLPVLPAMEINDSYIMSNQTSKACPVRQDFLIFQLFLKLQINLLMS